MKLNAPKKVTWLIAIVLGLLGLIGGLVTVPFLSDYATWLIFAGFALLALGTFLKGL